MIIDLKLQNLNDIIKDCRYNKYGANNNKKKEMRDISYYVKNMPKIEKYPIEIVCKWHIKNSCSDLDNKSIKSTLDCLQHLGILKNDNIKHITKIEYIAIKDERDYLELEIKEAEV